MKVLFVDTVHEILEQELTQAGHQCHFDLSCDYTTLQQKLHLYDGIVIRSRLPLDREILENSGLTFIARSGAGLENIDLVAAKELGIHVFNSPEGNRDAVGEQCIGMLLMLYNHLKRADAEVRQGIWKREENRGLEISGKTIGIIGYGQMGSAFAEKLQGFSCRVIAYDKYKEVDSPFATGVSLEELQNEADVISLHLPQTAETHYYIDDAFISCCAKPFTLINTARGSNVEIAALVSGLKSGKVSGACLDVLEYEKRSFESLKADELPADFQFLIHAENVILTPHIAGWTRESYVKLSSFLATKILSL